MVTSCLETLVWIPSSRSWLQSDKEALRVMTLVRNQHAPIRVVPAFESVTISGLNPDSSSHYCQAMGCLLPSSVHLRQSHLISHLHGALLHQGFSAILDMLNFALPIG
jgi:hypothetical protein